MSTLEVAGPAEKIAGYRGARCLGSVLKRAETVRADREAARKGVPRFKRVHPDDATGERARLELAIDRHPVRAFALLSLLYFVAVFALSSVKLLWLDEQITLHIAALPSVGAIWDALGRGADPNPPVTHVLVHFSRLLFGATEWAYRLPDFLGYWLGMVALFAYLRRRAPATWALGGTILSMTMAAFDYSYESRSYGIFYGLAMVAFWCWTMVADEDAKPSARWTALGGMILALAGGISTNYFAVLAFLPVGTGELTRTLTRLAQIRSGERRPAAAMARCIDVPVWAALLVSVLPLLAYRGMIAHSIAQFSPYAWNKVSLDQVAASYTEMVEVVLYPILALFVFAAGAWFLERQLAPQCDDCRATFSRRGVGRLLARGARGVQVPAHEMAGIFLLAAYPFLGYAIASIRGGMLSPRFVIPVCFGFAIAATLVSRRLLGGFASAGSIFVLFCLAWFVARESYVGYWYEEQKQSFYKVVDHLAETEGKVPAGAPIVIPDPLLALTFEHYAPPALAARAVFPVDFPAVRHYRGDDSPEQNLWAGRDFLYKLPVVPLATFQQHAGKYLIIAGRGNWLVQDLRDHGYAVSRLPIDTRANAIGGFTPLAHGTPMFYTACGDAAKCAAQMRPVKPFAIADNLPDAKSKDPSESTR